MWKKIKEDLESLRPGDFILVSDEEGRAFKGQRVVIFRKFWNVSKLEFEIEEDRDYYFEEHEFIRKATREEYDAQEPLVHDWSSEF